MAVHRDVYLEDIPLEEAEARLWAALEESGFLRPTKVEEVPLEEAAGRVTAGPVWAQTSSPHYHSAAMDGVAVRAEDTYGASRTSPKRLALGEQGQWVDTGNAIPPQFNAVIMVEDVQRIGEQEIEILASVAPWQHIRPLGEDMVATELVLPENHTIRATDIGAMAAAGLVRAPVRKRPRVAVIPTGSELVPPGSALQPGKIIESNSLVMAQLAKDWGAEPTRWPIVRDDLEAIQSAVQSALATHDVVLINAGSSAGSHDYTARVIQSLGRLLVHGIAIRPGHPVVIGIVQGKPVLGIPGYPVSCVLVMELLVRPLLQRLLGAASGPRPAVPAVMTRKVLSPLGQDEFLRVKVGKVAGRYVATPLARGAGVMMSLVRAEGMVRIPRFSEGVNAGETVEVELLRPAYEVDNTIVAIGSHDMTLDLLASEMRREHPNVSLSSSNVGSLGGLLALQRGEAHVAGIHLLDEVSGEYNVAYVRRMLAGRRVTLVNLVYRQQGLMAPRGNPLGITSLRDLARPEVAFINRQRGSGTRVLLDFELKKIGLQPEAIRGYEREEFTHTGVAAAIASGSAGVGLGILAAARALGLDFVPLLEERYDLAIPAEEYESSLLAPLLAMVRSTAFRKKVEELGGYDASSMGEVVATFGP
ncbi:MAG: molybdopterin biosynthesis protein [Chloroflexi bacterium]|nr:molybdopterin biosynthesis protein [Chloroflexota bacterium]